MPRTRSARAAVLGSVQRRPPPSPPSRGNPAVRRRLVAVALVLISLVLLTVYFRETSNGSLHGVQSTGASVLKPFEVAAARVARPFRDAAGWFGDVLGAKSENSKLRRDLAKERQEATQNKTALEENKRLRAILNFEGSPRFPDDYNPVNAQIISRAPSAFEQQIVISAGANRNIRVHDSVITPEGLVGQVIVVAKTVARVTLLTDQTSAVSAVDAQTRADGIVQHGEGSPDTLILDRVTKDQVVDVGDIVVTAGWRSRRFASIYPRDIAIGTVTSVSQSDIKLYKEVLVQPYVDFNSLEDVIVIIPKKRGG